MAARFAAAHDEVTFVGTPQGLESRLVPEAGVTFRPLPARGFDRSRPLTLITSTLLIVASAARAWWWMMRRRPDVVVGFGGYVSIPVGLAAVAARVPLVLHEQNSVPGLANRMLSRFARAIAVTYEESVPLLRNPERATLTGNPVRESVREADRESSRTGLGIASGERLVVVFGGSRGARHLNDAALALLPRLAGAGPVRVVHIAGAADAARVSGALEACRVPDGVTWAVEEYVDDMGSLLAASDLVVARAGATSIAEITARGVAAVLVPYPYATDDHQTRNAAALVEHGAAVLVADRDLDSERLGDAVLALLRDDGARATMAAASSALGRPDATERVAALIRAVA